MGIAIECLDSCLQENSVGCLATGRGEVLMRLLNFIEPLLDRLFALVREQEADLAAHIPRQKMGIVHGLILWFLSQGHLHNFILS